MSSTGKPPLYYASPVPPGVGSSRDLRSALLVSTDLITGRAPNSSSMGTRSEQSKAPSSPMSPLLHGDAFGPVVHYDNEENDEESTDGDFREDKKPSYCNVPHHDYQQHPRPQVPGPCTARLDCTTGTRPKGPRPRPEAPGTFSVPSSRALPPPPSALHRTPAKASKKNRRTQRGNGDTPSSQMTIAPPPSSAEPGGVAHGVHACHATGIPRAQRHVGRIPADIDTRLSSRKERERLLSKKDGKSGAYERARVQDEVNNTGCCSWCFIG